MTQLATFAAPRLERITARALGRGLLAGWAWGLLTGGGLLANHARQCDVVCLQEVVCVLAVSVAAGCLTMGPLVIFVKTA